MSTTPLWTAAGWTMLHLIWVGACVGLAAMVGRRLLRAARPETRYAFSLTCLLAFAVAPAALFARVFEPDDRLAITPDRPAATTPRAFHASAAALPPPLLSQPDSFITSPDRGNRAAGRAKLETLLIVLARLWMGGSLMTLALLGTGLVGLERLRQSSRIVEAGAVVVRCRALAGSLGIARRVGVGVCDRIATPLLIGIFRPLILLPPAALSGWSVDQLEMVLLHELAHLRRCDNLVNLAQRLIESLLFFHPVVWWLSGWVRLERELCCDRFVVARTGRACAYAEMLVALAGSGHERRVGSLAMADRQILTRVRRILNLEDRSMRLTMPEGLGLIAATLVASVLALGAYATSPPAGPNTEESARQTLQRAVDDVAAFRAEAPMHEAMKAYTLASIGEAQLKLGDRTSALATLLRASESIDRIDFKAGSAEDAVCLIAIVRAQRLAGDPAAARTSLERMAKRVESMVVDLADSSKVSRVDQDTRRIDHESGKVIQAELLAVIAQERFALGDRDEACALARRAVVVIGAEESPLKSYFLGPIAVILYKGGDPAGARDAVEQARLAALELPVNEDRAKLLCHVAQALSEIGDLEGAIRMTSSLPDESTKHKALRLIVDSLANDEQNGVWFDQGGIKITIGAETFTIEDRAAARRDLPRIAQAVRDTDGPLLQARTLSAIAHLQAKAGDCAGALATAESIPEIQRADFAGPGDGFYDAIKPATMALVARVQADAGDHAGAREGFRRAVTLCRAVAHDGEQLIARVVIARTQAEADEKAAARALLDESIALALRQSEPRRSRCLTMLAEGQLKAGEAAGAARTAKAIRAFPGLEKVRALQALAEWHEQAGDSQTALSFVRDALDCVEAKAPENPPLGQSRPLPNGISAHTFIDPDAEFEPNVARRFLENRPMTLRARIGDTEEALRLARAMPAERRDHALRSLAAELAQRGDVAGALALAATLKSPEDRLEAFGSAAIAVKDGPVRK